MESAHVSLLEPGGITWQSSTPRNGICSGSGRGVWSAGQGCGCNDNDGHGGDAGGDGGAATTTSAARMTVVTTMTNDGDDDHDHHDQATTRTTTVTDDDGGGGGGGDHRDDGGVTTASDGDGAKRDRPRNSSRCSHEFKFANMRRGRLQQGDQADRRRGPQLVGVRLTAPRSVQSPIRTLLRVR